ncbi:MAG TPA: isochorismate synthase [Actinomycetes bacterium]|nr:isochorismate synthase [Actinomycetes bacterium]
MSTSTPLAPTGTPVRVRSVPIADPGDLLALLPAAGALCWVRGTDGFAAWGEAARFEVSGADRISQAASWWRTMSDSVQVDDLVGVPGSGLVAFASFTFDDGPETSVVVVPRVVIGRRDGAAWVTTVDGAAPDVEVDAMQPLGQVRYSDGAVSSAQYEAAVAEAVRRVQAGDLEKVVLARDLLATSQLPIDQRAVLAPLAARYPSCWTFAVEGLVGATPELLVRRTGDHIVSRVLAGTISRGADAVIDAQHASELLASDKDRGEHEYAVRSVAEALAPFCSDLVVPRSPEIVRLANVQHLQTDVTGRLANGETALDLAAALHPTAAVCGTPTSSARSLIREIEGMDRGRYAGPVGWVDARGDGAFGIALRCAQIQPDDPRTVRMFAGCGIVRGSEPVAELAESQTKLLAIRDALESR